MSQRRVSLICWQLIMHDFPFRLRDKVKIPELEKTGRIVAIFITEKGVRYEVRYFDNAAAKEVYFYEDELIKT